jgi:hypothetical protein
LGNSIQTSAFVTDQFSGNNSTTQYTMSVAPAGTTSVLVSISGVLQDPSTYAVNGLTLTFSAAPPTGTGNISVRYLGVPASGIVNTAYRTVTEFTATAGQTTFSVPSYTAGFINVYRNGARLGGDDFTATNGVSVVLASAATAGELIVTESFYVSSVLNAIPATAGAVNSSYIADNAVVAAKIVDSGVTQNKIANGAVVASKMSTGGPTWDSAGVFGFNSGYGSVATAYGCRAWVNFNGTGTVAVRASGNVSSITDNGTGDYTVNFTTAMPDANYSVEMSGGQYYTVSNTTVSKYATSPTVSSFRLVTGTPSNSSLADFDYVYASFHR